MRQSARSTTGFTLVEVLLGIIILALGLLGLAAVFPLVVRQQRESQDTVVGVATGKGAEAVVAGNTALNSPLMSGGWGKVSWELYKRAFNNKNSGRVQWDEAFQQLGTLGAIYNDTGEFRVNSDLGLLNDVLIKPSDRVIPSTGSGATPQFVWDIAPSLAAPVTATQLPAQPVFQPLRVTVFVRRIDPGIRVPSNKSLGQVLADGRDGQGRPVYPVGANSDGTPSLDGRGVYAGFLKPEVTRAYRRFGASGGAFTVIELGGSTTEAELGAARQVSQQLVDVDGNVYTVVALPDETDQDYSAQTVLRRCVVIAPGLPAEYLQSPGSTGSPLRWQMRLLCTPQIPAAVTSFVVRR
ncbi:MAG: hypothetical protein JSS51_03105 [Planctomycetes bacterium]|nr:hypothetical protein [Planctomycetota bacterium]